MTIQAPSPPLNESLDYGQPLEFGYFLVGAFTLATPPDPDTLTTFIADVAPRVRERVAERRASSPVAAFSPERGA